MGATPHRGFWPHTPTRRAWHYGAALPLLLAMGVFAFVRGVDVPLLGWIDLAVHEFGHVWTFWMGRVGNLAMGVGTQVLVPLVLAIGMWRRSGDPLGAGLCLAWAGTSAQDGSVYIADAPFQRLPLIGGVHDWATLLGPQHLDALWLADDLGRLLWLIGLLLYLGGLGIVVVHGVRAWRHGPVQGAARFSDPQAMIEAHRSPGWTTARPGTGAPPTGRGTPPGRLPRDPMDPADPASAAWRPQPRGRTGR